MNGPSPLDNRTFQWLSGALFAIALAGASFIYNTLHQRIEYIETYGHVTMREKIAKLETETQTMHRDIAEIKQAQKEILMIIREWNENGAKRRK